MKALTEKGVTWLTTTIASSRVKKERRKERKERKRERKNEI